MIPGADTGVFYISCMLHAFIFLWELWAHNLASFSQLFGFLCFMNDPLVASQLTTLFQSPLPFVQPMMLLLSLTWNWTPGYRVIDKKSVHWPTIPQPLLTSLACIYLMIGVNMSGLWQTQNLLIISLMKNCAYLADRNSHLDVPELSTYIWRVWFLKEITLLQSKADSYEV